MKLTQLLTRSSLAAFALLNLSLATSAVAEPIIVTRGTHGAARIVNASHLPAGSMQLPKSEARAFPKLIQRGSHGAAHIVTEAKPDMTVKQVKAEMKEAKQVKETRLIRRGTHGAFTLSNR